ncbi:MAG: hypothetical protein ACPLSJ_04690 [Thermosulfidibacteraceae bacterium]|jgi:hypothetical protein
MNGMIFIAGIIQGSKRDSALYDQSYRERLKNIFIKYFPNYHIYCPVSNHPNCANYSDEEALKTFLYHLNLVRHSKLLVAYIPEASMGTAIEMWEAYNHNVPVWSITPMKKNWVVRITSKKIFSSIEELEEYLSEGGQIE